MAATPKQQLKTTRAEAERARKRGQRDHLKALRGQIRAAKQRRTKRMREVRCNCRDARKRNVQRAKQARERLRASIGRTHAHAKTICELAKGEARSEGLVDIGKAVDALNTERTHQRQLHVWTTPKRKEPSRKQRNSESDDQVANNIDDPGLLLVWEKVKAKVKASPRRSRTEAFFEWAAEHPALVYEIQEAAAVAELERLEREERDVARALKRHARAAVPF